jgi:hypothetical protein
MVFNPIPGRGTVIRDRPRDTARGAGGWPTRPHSIILLITSRGGENFRESNSIIFFYPSYHWAITFKFYLYEGEPLAIRDDNTPNYIVNQCLWRRELSYVQWLRVNGESDPHANLPTQSLSFLDHEKTMKFLLTRTVEEPLWQQFGISWCCNYATYLRMDSLRKIRLCDLLCEGRGYVQRDLNSQIIGLILQKYVHKDQTPQNPNARKRTKQKRGGRNPVGDNNGQSGQPIATGGKRVCFMWRHRIFECCGTSMIGISLFMRFFFDAETSFLEPELPPQPPQNNNNNNNPGLGVFEQPRRTRTRNNNNVSKKRELNANACLTFLFSF